MKVIEAVNSYSYAPKDVKLFLAGGITNCPEWQTTVIDKLSEFDLPDLVVFNPRRKNFPIHDPNASEEQITWEFNMLQNMDIFSMFFCKSPSDQPICMYELGRNLLRMQNKFPGNWDVRTVISCDQGYSRSNDVVIQSKLAGISKINLSSKYDALIDSHVSSIVHAYNYLKN